MDMRNIKALRLGIGMWATLAAATASADTLNVPSIPVSNTLVREYHCQGGTSLQVTYYNSAGGQSFALLPVKGKTMLFVDTLAASGVKYVAGPYAWWTKGEHGDLYDMMAGPDATPIIAGCTATPAR